MLHPVLLATERSNVKMNLFLFNFTNGARDFEEDDEELLSVPRPCLHCAAESCCIVTRGLSLRLCTTVKYRWPCAPHRAESARPCRWPGARHEAVSCSRRMVAIAAQPNENAREGRGPPMVEVVHETLEVFSAAKTSAGGYVTNSKHGGATHQVPYSAARCRVARAPRCAALIYIPRHSGIQRVRRDRVTTSLRCPNERTRSSVDWGTRERCCTALRGPARSTHYSPRVASTLLEDGVPESAKSRKSIIENASHVTIALLSQRQRQRWSRSASSRGRQQPADMSICGAVRRLPSGCLRPSPESSTRSRQIWLPAGPLVWAISSIPWLSPPQCSILRPTVQSPRAHMNPRKRKRGQQHMQSAYVPGYLGSCRWSSYCTDGSRRFQGAVHTVALRAALPNSANVSDSSRALDVTRLHACHPDSVQAWLAATLTSKYARLRFARTCVRPQRRLWSRSVADTRACSQCRSPLAPPPAMCAFSSAVAQLWEQLPSARSHFGSLGPTRL